MARLKIKTIDINELQCKDAIINELKLRLQTDAGDYNFNKVSILIKSKGPPPFIANVNKAIKSLERYNLCNKHLIRTINSEQIVKRKHLAKMLGISRPTLNKWISHGFIQPVPLRCMYGETFPVQIVLKQLISYRDRK